MSYDHLPRLGLGLSSNLNAADEPNPYRLLEKAPGLLDFVEYSAPLDVEETRAHASLFAELEQKLSQVPVLFHPVHLNLYGPWLEAPQQLRALNKHARAVGSPWVGNDVGWWHADGEPFPGYLYISPPLNEAGLENAVAHAEHVQSHLSVPLVLENPAVIAVRGQMHVLDFMAALHARTQRPMLLDLGHLYSHQLARGLPLTSGFDGFPFEHVLELHIAGGVVSANGSRRFYVDDHTQPVREELFELLEALLPRCTNLKALTFEGDGHPAEIAAITLRRLRSILDAFGLKPSTAGSQTNAPAPDALGLKEVTPDAPHATEALCLFDEFYGLAPAAEDAEGTSADVDFRLAVLAERLDRAYPLTRLLLAPTKDALMDFVRSEGFRACFREPRGSVEKAFGVWAINESMSRRDPALEAVLAFESFRVRSGRAMPAGFGGVDLREAEFAAKALRRHLCGRAWVSGVLEHSALEALWQIIRRAVSRPRAADAAHPTNDA